MKTGDIYKKTSLNFRLLNLACVKGWMQGVPEKNPALRSYIFSSSTWRCEGRGGGSSFKLWGATCLLACLPGQTWSVLFVFVFFLLPPSYCLFFCSAWSSTSASPFWLLVLSALVSIPNCFVCLSMVGANTTAQTFLLVLLSTCSRVIDG